MCCIFSCCCSSYDDDDGRFQKNDIKRRCTDVFFLFLFLVFCAGMVAITVYGIQNGDIYRIQYGIDSFGNTCGRENEALRPIGNESIKVPQSGSNMTDKRFLFPLDFRRPLQSLWVCVKECPTVSLITHKDLESHNVSLCVSPEISRTASSHSSDGHCPTLPVHPSSSVLNRCLPSDLLSVGMSLASEVINSVKDVDWVRICVNDVIRSAPTMLKAMGSATVLSLITVFLLRFLAPIAVYFIYTLIILVCTGISAALWYAWYTVYWASHQIPPADQSIMPEESIIPTKIAEYVVGEDGSVQKLDIASAGLNIDIDSFLSKQTTVSEQALIGFAIGATVITLFVIIITWCLLPRGKLLVDLFKEAGRAMASMPFLLIQPLITSLSILIIVAYCMWNALLLYTTGQPVPHVLNDTEITVIEYNVTETQKYMFVYTGIGLIWLIEFAFAYQRMLIVGAVSTWYFDKNCSHPVCTARWNTCRYHLGSIAFGSFIITLIRVPRYILLYIYAKMKASENEIVKKLFACCICCLAGIEKCLRFVNYNAYTVIAYTGNSFCPAAKTAVNILLDNAVQVATINTVGDFVLFLSKMAVSASSAAIYIVLTKDDPSIQTWWPSIIIVSFLAYQIANCFISVYEMVIDALFLCIAEDFSMEMDGASERRHHPEMMEYMERTLSHEESIRESGRRRKKINGRVYDDSIEMR